MLGGERFVIYPCRGEYVGADAKQTVARELRSCIRCRTWATALASTSSRLLVAPSGSGRRSRYQDRKDDLRERPLAVEAFVEPARLLLKDITVAGPSTVGQRHPRKARGPEDSFADFMIRRDRRIRAIVQAAGIDSPGLTSSLAIGRLVSESLLLIDEVMSYRVDQRHVAT